MTFRLSKYNILGLAVFLAVVFMSVGFALYKQDLGLNGDIALKKQSKLEIVSATIVESESENLKDYSNPTIDGLNVSFKMRGTSETFVATYLVEINNGSAYNYAFNNFPFSANLDTSGKVSIETIITNSTTGEVLDPGEIIPAEESRTYKIQFTITTDDVDAEVTIDGDATYTTDNTGNIIASITPTTGNLQDGAIACFTVSVANTYKYDRNFTLDSSNDNITLVNNAGTVLGTFSIGANTTESYEVCTKTAEGSTFLSDETTTIITLNSTGVSTVNVGELTLAVDNSEAVDTEAPKVGNVSLAIPEEDTAIGKALVSWDRIDTGGSSVTNYYIILYNSDTGTTSTFETGSALTSYTLTNLEEGNYYVKVYGEDEAGNIGESSCDSATTESGYCSLSNTTNLKWQFAVTYSLSKLSHDGSTSTSDTVTIYSSYSTTLAVNSSSTWDMLPSSVTITMGGTTLTSGTDYTYDSSSGKITINKVTGDITITASAMSICLVKGTLVTLADGSTKKIEDITYEDLLLVWNYETGTYTYEYPIWIEQGKTTSHYQKTTFSDGTVLKTVGRHGVFSKDLNQFVSVHDGEKFKVGTEIAKLNADNELEYVKVVSIEVIDEPVEYYHVVSTRYYNIIANNVITTDGTVILSNLYNFGENITWENRDYDALELYDYSLFSDVMPYYMFKGLRVEEGEVLSAYLDFETFKNYLLHNQLNDEMLLKPEEDGAGNRLWKVTTSDDLTFGASSATNSLFKEGSYYFLKEPLNKIGFKGWLNTADGELYQPGDMVRVDYGMHFVAEY